MQLETKKHTFFKWCLLSLGAVLFSTTGAEARDIYVRLADKPSGIALSSSAEMKITGADRKTVSLGKSVVLSRSGVFAAAGKSKFALPARISSSGLLSYNKKRYRGEFLLTKEFVLINVLDLEDYLRGVLPAEAGAKWPIEALKVQAIISRTYALRQSMNRSARGYDLADTTADQVYRGAGVEKPKTDQAVRETEGLVLAYGTSLAQTFFHSDSGGHTANNAHVWGAQVPYLCGVREAVPYTSPNSNWVAKIPATQVQSALAKLGCSVGGITEIRVADTDAGGRATRLTFVGNAGSKTINSSQFRTAVGPNLLKSTMLSAGKSAARMPAVPAPKPQPALPPKESSRVVEAANGKDGLPKVPVPTSETPMTVKEEARLTRMTANGVFNSAELMDMLVNPKKRKGYLYLGIQRSGGTLQPPAVPPSPTMPQPIAVADNSSSPVKPGHTISLENGVFVFQGKGWGHGVGLSQWGAFAMANQGWNAERILEHYYPGTGVKKFK